MTRAHLFVVSQTSITSHQLPKRAEIEAATRRVRELLTAPQPRPGDTEAKYQARVKEAREGYWAAGRRVEPDVARPRRFPTRQEAVGDSGRRRIAVHPLCRSARAFSGNDGGGIPEPNRSRYSSNTKS